MTLATPTDLDASQREDTWRDVEIHDLILNGERFKTNLTSRITAANLERTIEGASTLTITFDDKDREILNGDELAPVSLVDATAPPPPKTAPSKKAAPKSNKDKTPPTTPAKPHTPKPPSPTADTLPAVPATRPQDTIIKIDNLKFALVKVAKQGDLLEMTFEDKAVHDLRKYRDPKSATRSAMTRAEFIQLLVQEVKEEKIPMFCPELHVKAPVSANTKTPRGSTNPASPTQRAATHAGGIPKGSHVAGLTDSQIRNVNTALDTAAGLGANNDVAVAIVMLGIIEADLGNPPCQNDGTGYYSVGYVQLGGGRSPSICPSYGQDVAKSVAECLTAKKPNGGLSSTCHAGGLIAAVKKYGNSAQQLGQAIQAVQVSAFPSRYQSAHSKAVSIVARYGYTPGSGGGAGDRSTPGSTPGTSNTKNAPKSYTFTRGAPGGPRDEDSWACIQRLASEVQWRAFMVGPLFNYVEETALILGMPLMTLDEGEDGIYNIDFEADESVKVPVQEATVSCRASRWSAPPGSVVEIVGLGPANGRWIVTQHSRSLFSKNAQITLKTPLMAKPEPAEDATSTGGQNPGSKPGKTPAGATPTGDSVPPKIAGGANRSGVAMRKPILDFLAEVGGVLGHAVTVSTGTNHKQYASSGNQSDHWTGDAADMGTATNGGVSGCNKIASAALQVVGLSKGEADQIAQKNEDSHTNFSTSYTWQGHRVQIGWRCADHYDHVHCGVKP